MSGKAVPEETYLKPLPKPKDPALINSDSWPIFSLRKASVVSQDTGKPVSLLSAHKNNPVKVKGRLLEVEDDLQHLVRDKNYKLQWIELTDVKLYAFAEYMDGTYGFWAAGKSGWFEFESVATTYRYFHSQMSEATAWIYILADKIKKEKTKVSGIDGVKLEKYMQTVFSDYLSQSGNPYRFSDIGDVRQAFHEHRQFLITSMLEGQEGVFWLDTPIFTYFKKHFPEEVADLAARIIPPPGGTTAEATEAKTEAMPEPKKRRSESSHIEDPAPKQKKGRPSRELTPSQPRTPPPKSLPENAIPDDDDDDSIVVTRKRRSFLRPSGAKSAKKAKTASSSLKISSALDGDDDSDDENVEIPIPAVRDTTLATIKNGEHLNRITNPRIQSNDDESRDRSSAPQYLPLKYLELSVAEYDIPSTKPQGPGGLWTCSFEDCRARVHQAGTDSGQERVKEHLKTHIVKERIDLVIDESKPYLPVDNLVRRLQAFAPPSGEELAPDSIERTFSAPLRRRY